MTLAMLRLLPAATILALALPAPALAAPSTTPTLPVPASAQPGGGASTPTTTYVPSSPLPGAAAKGLPTTTSGQPATALKSTSSARAGAHAHAKPSGKLSTAAIVVAALAALLALGCAAWGLARRRAFEPHWLLALRHAMAEAGFRMSATWAEFADWARLGH